MRIFNSRYFLLILFWGLSGCIAQAMQSSDARDCCNMQCYECSCNPLYECSWGLQFQAGIRPIIWRNRGNIVTVNCVTPPATGAVNVLQEIPSFHTFYKLPWQVGGQLSYALSCNTNLFVEFNYAQAKQKNKNCNAAVSGFQCTAIAASGFALNLTKYKLYDAFIGTRYYFDRWCDRVSLFVGGKIGLVHHKPVNFLSLSQGLSCNTGATTVFCTSNPANQFFKSNTVFAGGGQLGLDICFCGNWSLVLTGEVVVSCGPRTIDSLVLNTTDTLNLNGASNLLVGDIGNEVAFPVTLGIKYNF